jgi:hypothetical protein
MSVGRERRTHFPRGSEAREQATPEHLDASGAHHTIFNGPVPA